MRLPLALVLALAALTAGCGGGGAKTTFTNANWGDLEVGAQTGRLDGSPVDFVGQVYFVPDRDEPDAIWFMVYADPARQNFITLVKYPVPDFDVERFRYVHVVGVADRSVEVPTIVMWGTEPIVVASKVTGTNRAPA